MDIILNFINKKINRLADCNGWFFIIVQVLYCSHHDECLANSRNYR